MLYWNSDEHSRICLWPAYSLQSTGGAAVWRLSFQSAKAVRCAISRKPFANRRLNWPYVCIVEGRNWRFSRDSDPTLISVGEFCFDSNGKPRSAFFCPNLWGAISGMSQDGCHFTAVSPKGQASAAAESWEKHTSAAGDSRNSCASLSAMHLSLYMRV